MLRGHFGPSSPVKCKPMNKLCHCWRCVTVCRKFPGGGRWLCRQLDFQPHNKHVNIGQVTRYRSSVQYPIQHYRREHGRQQQKLRCSSALSIRFEQMESSKQRHSIILERHYRIQIQIQIQEARIKEDWQIVARPASKKCQQITNKWVW